MLIRYTALCTLLAVALQAMATDVSTPGDIAARLNGCKNFAADARFEVWLPNASDPVEYSILMLSANNGGADTLSACDYLIDWTLTRAAGESRGFSAYFGGNHYRYRDGRLQEYHYTDNPAPFAPGGDVAKGVQRQAQFVDYLPGPLAAELMAMESDSTYSYKVSRRGDVVSVSGNRSIDGNEVRTFTYSFNASDGMPQRLDIDTNPGQISEQAMTVEYTYGCGQHGLPHSEDALMALYPEEFARFRQNDFRLEKLPGQRLPEFSVQAVDGGRMTHHKSDAFDAPVVLLLLDSGAGTPGAVLEAVRRSVELYPGTVQPVTAFVDNRLEDVEGVCGHPIQGERVLYGARALARDCGVTVTPTLIFVNSDGVVENYIQGMNKNLGDEVLEMISNLK